jgi:hypothetical protein
VLFSSVQFAAWPFAAAGLAGYLLDSSAEIVGSAQGSDKCRAVSDLVN